MWFRHVGWTRFIETGTIDGLASAIIYFIDPQKAYNFVNSRALIRYTCTALFLGAGYVKLF